MEERYNVLKQEQMEEFFIDSPIQAIEYQILFDKETNKNIARIKFHNFGNEDVASVSFTFIGKNASGKKICSYKWSLVLAEHNKNADFGVDKIYEINPEVTSIALNLLKVAQNDQKPKIYKKTLTIKEKFINNSTGGIMLEKYNSSIKNATDEYRKKQKKNKIIGWSIPAALVVIGAIITLILASTEQSWAYEYRQVDGGYEITDYNGFVSNVEIPAEHNGQPVVAIGSCAFSYSSSLTSITIPSSVKSIGSDAFYGTKCIEKEEGIYYVDKWVVDCDESICVAIIREDTIGIADCAFEYCSSLTRITIPFGVESIGRSAFFGCSKLINLLFKDTSNWYKNGTAVNASELSNESTNATRFRGYNSYYSYYWYKKSN